MTDATPATAACGSTLRYDYGSEVLQPQVWSCERPAGHGGVHSCDSASWGRADHERAD